MGGRGAEGQSGGSFCSFFLSSSKDFSSLGYQGGELRGPIGGGGCESPHSSSTFKFLFSSIFHLLPGLHEFGICAGLILLTFSRSTWCPCTPMSSGGWMQWMRKEFIGWDLNLLYDYSYLILNCHPVSWILACTIVKALWVQETFEQCYGLKERFVTCSASLIIKEIRIKTTM